MRRRASGPAARPPECARAGRPRRGSSRDRLRRSGHLGTSDRIRERSGRSTPSRSYSTPMPRPLVAVPNFSEGRSAETIAALADALGRYAQVLDVHADPDHHRSVFTIAGSEAQLVDALVEGIARARDRIDLR